MAKKMNTNNQLYLNKDKTIDIHIMGAGNSYHVSFYNDKTDKSVAYTCSRDELKGLADFIYTTIGEKKCG